MIKNDNIFFDPFEELIKSGEDSTARTCSVPWGNPLGSSRKKIHGWKFNLEG
jgi:hypothetical protein